MPDQRIGIRKTEHAAEGGVRDDDAAILGFGHHTVLEIRDERVEERDVAIALFRRAGEPFRGFVLAHRVVRSCRTNTYKGVSTVGIDNIQGLHLSRENFSCQTNTDRHCAGRPVPWITFPPVLRTPAKEPLQRQ